MLWGGVCLGVIAIVTIIIVLILTKGGDSSKDSEDGGGGKKPDEDGKGTDEVSPDVYGNIIAVYDVKKGNVKLLSDDFEKDLGIHRHITVLNNVAFDIGLDAHFHIIGNETDEVLRCVDHHTF